MQNKTRHFVGIDFSFLPLLKQKTFTRDIVVGDLSSLPFTKKVFDGIWNAGVLEHLNEKEIQVVLRELHRVLKPGRSCILFWHRKNALPVQLLRFITFLKKDKTSYLPKWNTLLTSHQQIEKMIPPIFEIEKMHSPLHAFLTFDIVVLRKRKD